jgi:glycosyltransferase involved in cell wall biosynthesis
MAFLLSRRASGSASRLCDRRRHRSPRERGCGATPIRCEQQWSTIRRRPNQPFKMNTSSSPVRLLPASSTSADPLRIAIVAPPWITVPPPGYGGIETVVDLLCEALVSRGHEVTLFAAPGSRSAARVYPLLEDAHPDEIGSSLHESDHVACAWGQIDLAADQGVSFDVLHDHSGFTALAMADRVDVPVVHTIHGPFVRDTTRFYRRHGHKALLVAISRTQAQSAPAGVRISAVVPNPIAVDRWPLRSEKQDYLLWIGRMDPVKGAHRAIEAARLASRTLVLAGPVQTGQQEYFRERVEPHIDGRRVHYVGEVAGVAKRELYANAAALLMPVRWREPFGMVMVEALACGTPVIAFPEGAAAEIVIEGENGVLVADEVEMARAVAQIGSIDPARCRASVADRYDISVTAAGYERVYRQAIEGDRGHEISPAGVHTPPNGPTTRVVGEHWQRRSTADDETEVRVSRAGANDARRVEMSRRRGGQ